MDMPLSLGQPRGEEIFSGLISDRQLAVYAPLLAAVREHGLRAAVGGGLAASAYSGYVRNTKDMDLFVVPPDQEALVEIMREQGFAEYTEVEYDPTWSYRGHRKGFIVDLLWRMLNDRGTVDDVWTSGGWRLDVRGTVFPLVPPEELIFSKLYILRRERTDWPDILNIIYAQGPALDWERLLARVGEDAAVLGGVMSLFRWMCPGRSCDIPAWVWERIGLEGCSAREPSVDRRRTGLFRSDDWFTQEV